MLSWLANKYIGLVAGIPIRDTTSGYRGYRREVLEEADFDRIKIKGYVVHGEMAYQAWMHGFRLGEVPIHFRNRRARRLQAHGGGDLHGARELRPAAPPLREACRGAGRKPAAETS